ncbi:MAG: hypothetical protein H6719_34200 [Sandaracinaceae bacterium]|nr:hypothetical protein [Sandaracinaceae bacterium]
MSRAKGWRACALALLTGCGAAPAAVACPAITPCPSAPPPVVEVAAEAPAPNRCLATAPDAPTPPTARDASEVCANHLRAERALRRELTAAFQRTVEGSVVDVSFGCDGLGEDVMEIDLELGYGHGGSLSLWRLRREGEVFRVQGVGLLHRRRASEGSDPYALEADRYELGRAEGEVPAATVDRALDRVRAALTARLREIEPTRPPRGGSGFGSSSDFHAVIEIADDEGRRLGDRYTGYESSPGQRRYLAVQLARDALFPLIEPFGLTRGEATDADRDLFQDRLEAAAPHLDERFAWWVRERMAWLAAQLGTPRSIPILLPWLEGPSDEAGDRTRRLVANALAAITGWDERSRDDGPRPIDEVAEAYLVECRAALAP